MKNLIIIAFVSLSIMSSCDNNECIQGDGSTVTEERDLGLFTSINNSTSADINISNSTDSITIIELTGEENIIEQIITNLNGNVIEIDNNSNCLNTTRSTEISIYQTNISDINNFGTGNISGVVSFNIITITNDGTGDINLSGASNNGINIINEGTGEVNVESIESQDLTVQNNGTGDIYVNALSSLSGTISGTGDVYYKGNPTIDITISGLGEVIDNN